MTEQQISSLFSEVVHIAREERPEAVNHNIKSVELFMHHGINMIQGFERMAKEGTEVRSDTDVVYIDSGPGPIAVSLVFTHNRNDFPDENYHEYPWSRRMDRQRTIAAYNVAAAITSKRMEEKMGIQRRTEDLTPEDFQEFGPHFMYTSTNWQNAHFRESVEMYRRKGLFRIPDRKLIIYDTFLARDGNEKPIVHTEDQIEGLKFPKIDGNNPRNVAIVSHPAHLMRILHILGKYPDSIPEGTTIQPFPVPTPESGVVEYAKAELLGTIGTILGKNRATFTPYKI